MTEMLTMYQDLWSRIKDMKCSAEGSATMRKRKFEDYQWDNLTRVYETSAKSDEEVYWRAQENTSAKVSRVYLQVDPADMSLVSCCRSLLKSIDSEFVSYSNIDRSAQ